MGTVTLPPITIIAGVAVIETNVPNRVRKLAHSFGTLVSLRQQSEIPHAAL